MSNKSSISDLSVIVPVYNEESTIKVILEKLCKLKNVKEVIVVDDGSIDNTPQIVEEARLQKVRLIRQEKNYGKTSAVRRGLQEVTGDISKKGI